MNEFDTRYITLGSQYSRFVHSDTMILSNNKLVILQPSHCVQ